MRKASFVILIILALLSVSAVAYLWTDSLINSIYGYRTPLKGMPPLTEYTTRPLTSQVVLVVADGLRYDTSFQMPYLNHLRQEGAQAQLVSSPPSGSQAAWTALLSGARPEINDAPMFDQSYEWIRPITVDHLFAALNRTGLTGGIAGFHWWERLVPSELLHIKYYVTTEDDAADALAVDRALTFLKEFHPNLLLVGLRQINTAGQMYGAFSTEYAQAISRCDQHIRLLASNMDLHNSVLVIVSGHGHLDQGGHGGNEAVTLNTPFIMVGESIQRGDHGLLRMTDLAPTIATLLGAPIPAAALGTIRTDMLQMDSIDKAHKLVALADQRMRMGSIYLYSMGTKGLAGKADEDVQVALSSLQVGNYESAHRLAQICVDGITREMTEARRSRVWQERYLRVPPVLLASLVPLWMMWRRRSWGLAWSTTTALLAALGYHVLYVQQGNLYSFSQIPAGGLAATLAPGLRWAAATLVTAIPATTCLLWCRKDRSVFSAIAWTYGHAGLQLYFIGLAVSACTWWNGPRFTWYVADLTVAYVHSTALLQAILVAALAVPLPLIVIVLQQGLLFISDQFELRRAQR